jgi:hypothetical protein
MQNCCNLLLAIIALLTMVLMYMHACPNTKSAMRSSVDGTDYKVINYFNDQEKAADMLAYINKNNLALIEFMTARYITKELSSKVTDPEWVNHYATLTRQLINRYKPHVLSENDPPDPYNTSWTENKGEVLTMCVREKLSGKNDFHDLNVLVFVGVHEMTHIASIEYGHDEEFWFNFKCLLDEAVEMGIYTPVDYSKNPINYCSLELKHNPLYDSTIAKRPSDVIINYD